MLVVAVVVQRQAVRPETAGEEEKETAEKKSERRATCNNFVTFDLLAHVEDQGVEIRYGQRVDLIIKQLEHST